MFLGRVVKPGEPLWTDEDRAWALALHAEESSTCSGCHQPLAESTDGANEFAYEPVVYRCHACTAKGRGEEKYKDEAIGLRIGVKLQSR